MMQILQSISKISYRSQHSNNSLFRSHRWLACVGTTFSPCRNGGTKAISLVARQKTLNIPSKTLVLTITDKVYQHVGSNAHSTIVSIGADIAGVSGDSRSTEKSSLKSLCVNIRKNLQEVLSSTFWQVNLINRKQIHFQCTKIPDANAGILFNIMMQLVIEYIENLVWRVLADAQITEKELYDTYTYELSQTYCTCTPDARKAGLQTNTHFLVFKRRVEQCEMNSNLPREEGEKLPISTKSPIKMPRRKRRKIKVKLRSKKNESEETTEKLFSHSLGPEIPRRIHTQMENLWPDP